MPRPSPGGALLYVRCFWTAAPPPIGGNCTTRGFDTPATLRKRASCSAKPPSPARRTPGHGGLGRTAHERCQGAAIAQQLARALRQSKTLFAQQQPRRAPWVQNSPSTSCAAHFRYKTLPAHPPSPHIRYKTLPAHPSSPHIRYKTLPAHPRSPHIRYKTRPARAARPTSGTKLSQQESHGPLPVQNSPSTPTLAACAVQNSPRTPEIAQFGAFSACRESFIPFSPPRS